MLSEDEERRLVAGAKRGDRGARDRLLREFEPLVLASAAQHMDSQRLRFDDLAQEGRVALLKRLNELNTYDPERGRLSTWLKPAVKGAIKSVVAAEAKEPKLPGKVSKESETEIAPPVLSDATDKDEETGECDDTATCVGAEGDDDDTSKDEDAGEHEEATASYEIDESGFGGFSRGPWERSRQGPSSARDRYLQDDRFVDVKEGFVDFKREIDPAWRLREATWETMTRSPRLKSLLQEVRDQRANFAQLEQEYDILAPPDRDHRATTEREFTLHDERSKTLARMVCHAVEEGSVPERAQWAALGVADAVTAVRHFREWYLGGRPTDLWPETATRLFATDQWVEQQAQREPAPDPEFILFYGDGKMRAIARSGTLAALKECASQLVRQFGWREDQAVRFIVSGFAETTPKLRGRIEGGGAYRATARVVMDIDPRTSPDEVLQQYDRWRRTLGSLQGGQAYAGHDRSAKERTLGLAVYIEENWRCDMEWKELEKLWNEQHPSWRFPDDVRDPTDNFANHARQAWTLMTGESWPKDYTQKARRSRRRPRN